MELLSKQNIDRSIIDSPEKAFEHMRFLGSKEVEELWLLSLDSQLKLLCVEMLFKGGRDQCPVDPREIIKSLIRGIATSFILVHNHPSGNVDASEEDHHVTEKVAHLARLFSFKMEDHLIIGGDNFLSFRKQKIGVFSHSEN